MRIHNRMSPIMELFAFYVFFCIYVLIAVAAVEAPKNDNTILVGYGCEGSNGAPMFYVEEDDFPPCSLIERIERPR